MASAVGDRALELLDKFEWKGVIALHLKQLGTESKGKALQKAKFMVNLKAKGKYLREFMELTEFERLRKEKWEKPGFYFKMNVSEIPSISLDVSKINFGCIQCNKL